MVQIKSKGDILKKVLLLMETDHFVLFKPSTNWMMSTNFNGGNLFYLVVTGLNEILSKIPSNLPYGISHHRY